MSDLARSGISSLPLAGRRPPHGRVSAQPRPDLADQLERLTPRFDSLTQKARLGPRSVDNYLDIEEMAQAFARDLLEAVRGAQPTSSPLWASADGTQVVW